MTEAPLPADDKSMQTTVYNSRSVQNKYEAAIVSAMEARRLNDITRVTGESLSARVTQMAIENVRLGNVNYVYEQPAEPAPTEPAEES